MLKQNNKRTNIMMSVVALLLILVLAAGITFSWVEGNNRGYVETGKLVISSGSNLVMRQDGGVVNNIIIPACDLHQVSSADGRNFFVPMEYNTSTNTSEMIFREGRDADANKKYVVLDFQLQAGDTTTPVYLGAGTVVKCDNQDVTKALRMSFSTNDGAASKVFMPTQMPGVSGITYSPITAVSYDGKASTTTTPSLAYGDYYYKGDGKDAQGNDLSKPIFSLDPGETKDITLSIWLEGTVEGYDFDSFASKDLEIYIDFTTYIEDLTKYTFVDNTHGYNGAKSEYWVTNKADNDQYDTMMYLYDIDTDRYYAMSKIIDKTTSRGSEWNIYVPKTIDNFTFRRYSITVDTYWNQWEPDMGNAMIKDPNGEYTYIAICGNRIDAHSKNDGCYGYWQDANDTIRIYIDEKNTTGWKQVICKAYDTTVNKFVEYEMTFIAETFTGNVRDGDLWCCDIKNGSKITGLQFTDTEGNLIYEFYSSDAQYYFNGFATWYKDFNNNGKASNSHWIYTESDNSLIHPDYVPATS